MVNDVASLNLSELSGSSLNLNTFADDTTKLVNNQFFVDSKFITYQNSVLLKPGLSWKLETVVDYNGDAKDDMLWRDYNSGENAIWWMNGSTLIQGRFISQGESILKNDTKWEIVG